MKCGSNNLIPLLISPLSIQIWGVQGVSNNVTHLTCQVGHVTCQN